MCSCDLNDQLAGERTLFMSIENDWGFPPPAKTLLAHSTPAWADQRACTAAQAETES